MSASERPWLLGDQLEADVADFGEGRAFDDHKIAFVVGHSRGRDVLDVGCVQHNPANYRSRYWVHGALREVAARLVGLDLYEPGVEVLRERGFDVRRGDAEAFDLGESFDVVVAGDVIEHLGNLGGLLASALAHLRPGGKLLLSTPNPWYWRHVAAAALRGRVGCNGEHTCWLCPTTLSQLGRRHGLAITSVHFGSRYLRDRLMPLPRGIKHTSFHAVLERTP